MNAEETFVSGLPSTSGEMLSVRNFVAGWSTISQSACGTRSVISSQPLISMTAFPSPPVTTMSQMCDLGVTPVRRR